MKGKRNKRIGFWCLSSVYEGSDPVSAPLSIPYESITEGKDKDSGMEWPDLSTGRAGLRPRFFVIIFSADRRCFDKEQ